MKRIEFLKKLGLSAVSTATLMACKTEDVSSTTGTTSNTTGSTNGTSATNCTVTPTETVGPFPNKNSTKVVFQDIRSDRKGVLMTAKITIKAKSTNCAALKGVIVDVWHCDADGNYSEYGGTGMQATNYQNVSFLRGRQTTDTDGLVTFTSIFPGWYGGRAPHIHVHIYDAAGKSLLVTQIAFPKEVCDNVYTNAKTFYTKGLQDTTNERDNVFGDGFANELAGLSGSINDGYTLIHTIVVNA